VYPLPAAPGTGTPGNLPEAPTGLSAPARAVWDAVLPELSDRLTRRDANQLAAYCEAVALHAEAQRIVRTAGLLIKGPDGAARVNPAVAVAERAARTMLAWAREFGLTPAAREQRDAPSGAGNIESLLS
jgi:P27 family predicted phage terminase small subunit